MIRLIVTGFAFCLLIRLSGQVNLVANPSFEDTISCVGGYPYDPATPATNWSALGSVDYFSDYYCSGYVPLNSPFGFQAPFDGNGYFGFGAYMQPYNNDIREYLFTALTQPLTAGKKYCISFYVSLADSMDLGIKNIGIAFTSDSIPFNGPNIQQYMYSLIPQFESPDIITDKIGWVKVSGEYLADGTEVYFTIGNFRTFNATTYQVIDSPAWPWSGAYYFIDMVSVIEAPNVDAGIDQTVFLGDSAQLQATGGMIYLWSPVTGLDCSTCANPKVSPTVTTTYIVNVNDTFGCGNSDSVQITVVPKPPKPLNIPTILTTGDLFYIQSIPVNSGLRIFDLSGKMVYQTLNYQNDFSLSNLSAANYLYEITFADGSIQKEKFCVVKQ